MDGGAWRDEWKFARSEFVSSVLDFSKVGRRIIEGPPVIILLYTLSVIILWGFNGGTVRGG